MPRTLDSLLILVVLNSILAPSDPHPGSSRHWFPGLCTYYSAKGPYPMLEMQICPEIQGDDPLSG